MDISPELSAPGLEHSSDHAQRRQNLVVIISNNDWNDFWYQRQEFARRFAERGDRVIFLNKTMTRLPKFRSVFAGHYRSSKRGYVENPIPPGVEVLTPLWLPPHRLLRPINRRLIRGTLASVSGSEPLVIIYAPSYNAIDACRLLKARSTVYINVHNYEAKSVMPDILRAERELVRSADHLLADSQFNVARLTSKAAQEGRADTLVGQSLPGTAVDTFSQAYRGDEASTARTLGFYGGIGGHLDLRLYAELSRTHKIVFIGKVAAEMEGKIPSGIEIRPPVPVDNLGSALTDIDILALFYTPSAYIAAVIPAKVFECLATGKPLLVSGLSNLVGLEDAIYDVHGSATTARAVLGSLAQSETGARRESRRALAEAASWEVRFNALSGRVDAPAAASRTNGETGAASKMRDEFRRYYQRTLSALPDKAAVRLHYLRSQHRPLRLANPLLFTEKLQWLKICDRDPRKVVCADKLAVREYVAARVGAERLIPLLASAHSAQDLDWEQLPHPYIAKTNHGSGHNIAVFGDEMLVQARREPFDPDRIRQVLTQSLQTDYSLPGREWEYGSIPRQVLVETLLSDESGNLLLNDYKIHCFDGQPLFVQMITNRAQGIKETWYDTSWNLLPVHYFSAKNDPRSRPENLDELLVCAEMLANGFKYVRVDLYSVKGKVYFGEMTFHPAGGFMRLRPSEWDRKLGDLLHIPADPS